QMPGMSGLDALQRLRSDGSALPCLFVTTFGEDDYIAEAIRLDADGFVLKSGDPRQLIAGVHAVAGRGALFSPWPPGVCSTPASRRRTPSTRAPSNASNASRLASERS